MTERFTPSWPAMRYATVLIAVLGFVGGPLRAQAVRVEAGRILFHDPQGRESRVTESGRDTLPVLSPGGEWIAFVRRAPGDSVETVYGSVERTELWIVRRDGTESRRLAQGRGSVTPARTLAGLTDPAFAPDGRTVYVASAGWVTSGGLHAVAVTTGRVRFLCPANGFEVLTQGRYLGYLLVNQHRYRASGSYEGTWLVAPSGRSIRLVTLDAAADATARLAAMRVGRAP